MRLRIYLNILLCFFSISCNSQKEYRETDSSKVYLKILNELPHLPPPSPEIMMNKKLLKKYTDSLSKKKLNVGLLTKTRLLNDTIKLNNHRFLLSLLNKEKQSMDINFNYIKSYSINNINAFDEFGINIYKNNPNLDWFISFSNVVFDKKKRKALLAVYSSIDKLSGSSKLFVLKKKKEEWIIIETVLLNIS